MTYRWKNPKCKCCDSGKFLIERKGGGFRCERCKTIFNEYGDVIGKQNMHAVNTFDPKRILEIFSSRKKSKEE